jgi:site-specific recombinase XerD
MPKFRNGLAKVGRVYHFKFTQDGQPYGGSTRCEHRGAAEAWLQQYRENLALEKVGLRSARALPTLAQTLEEWTRAQTGAVADRHLVNVRSSLELHLQTLLSLTLDQITTEAVEDARAAYLNNKGTGHRPGQEGEWELAHTMGGANKVVQNLGSVVGWAVRRGTIPSMPFKLAPLKPQAEVEPVLWPEKVQAFLEAAAAGHKRKTEPFPPGLTAMRLMLQLGLREAEARTARWEWLDRRRQVYTVGQAKNRELREIHVPAALMDHLDRVLGPTTALPAGLILPAEDGAAHRPGFTAKLVERCAALVGVPGLHPHRLRASFATTHFEAGTPLSQIQQMMGHEDPETTMRYIVQRPKDQAVAQERVAELMGFSAAKGNITEPAVSTNDKDN